MPTDFRPCERDSIPHGLGSRLRGRKWDPELSSTLGENMTGLGNDETQELTRAEWFSVPWMKIPNSLVISLNHSAFPRNWIFKGYYHECSTETTGGSPFRPFFQIKTFRTRSPVGCSVSSSICPSVGFFVSVRPYAVESTPSRLIGEV
jgi:hypothetical protein